MISIDQAFKTKTRNKVLFEGNTYSGLDWLDETEKPTEEEIQAKIDELEATEPMILLKEERNQRICRIFVFFLIQNTKSSMD